MNESLSDNACAWQQILDEEMRYKIVDEIFDQIDLDDNGTIAM